MHDASLPQPHISVIVPVGGRHADLLDLHRAYRRGIQSLGQSFEFIFVIDGPRPEVATALSQLATEGENITIVTLARFFGESTALMAGLERARGQIIVTLPAYHQIDENEIPLLVRALDNCDMAVGYRWPRAGNFLERARRAMFHRMVRRLTKLDFNDLGCSARAMKRKVGNELQLYGDLHRFIPVLADRQGFRVREVKVRQSSLDRFEGYYQPREYARRFLDLFTVLFLVRFTKRPLRFFGMIGVTTFLVGALLIVWLIVDRLIFRVPLADRPALLISSLVSVFGIQMLAIGLLGELIIFTHARQIKDYEVDEVIQFQAGGERIEATS